MQAWAGFAGVGAVLWAAHVGRTTFDDWQRQKRAERRMEAAERLLTLVYRAQRTFAGVRNPGAFWAERKAAEERLLEQQTNFRDMDEEEQERYTTSQVILDRLRANKELWSELFQCLPLAKAFFGAACEQKLDMLWQLHARLLLAANEYAKLDPAGNQALSDRYFYDLVGSFGADDAFDKELLGIVLFLEEMLLPQIVEATTSHKP
jgi:hypothetical protein